MGNWIEDIDNNSKEYDKERKEDAKRFDDEVEEKARKYDEEVKRNFKVS